MKGKSYPVLFLLTVLILTALACNLSSTASTPTPEPVSVTEAPLLIPENTPTTPPETNIEPSPTPEPTQTDPPPTEETQQCTVVQDLNVRSGPGLAYYNPVGFVPKDTVVEPTSYYPTGVPGGTWALIDAGNNHPAGWIAAGESFITCNFNLSSLPEVQVDAPPVPRPPSAASSNIDGFCNFKCDMDVDGNYLVRFRISDNGKQLTEKDGIAQVEFVVTKNGPGGPEIYRKVETNADYCIFGGDGPCNTWEIQDNFYYFWPGGPQLEAGKYYIAIYVTDKDGILIARWASNFQVNLP